MRETRVGVELLVEVQPGARDAYFPAGIDIWRGRIKARVRSRAKDGEANEELVTLVAARLGVAESDVEIVSGHKSREKKLRVARMTSARVVALLEAAL